MTEPKKKEQKRMVIKKSDARCPHCQDQIYSHVRKGEKDAAGNEIIICTSCFKEYAVKV